MKEHTFLFEEGLWVARGQYFDQQGRAIPTEGQARITHGQDRWFNQGYMRLLAGPGLELENNYEIVPFPPAESETVWQSLNPGLGALRGRYVLVGDSILSSFVSADGRFSGTEFLFQVEKTVYQCRGFLFQGEKRLSSWAVELKKIE